MNPDKNLTMMSLPMASPLSTMGTSDFTEWTTAPASQVGTEGIVTELMNKSNVCSVPDDIAALDRAEQYLWLTVGSFLIVCGTLGNCFTLAVLHSKHFKVWASGTVFALSVLSVVDTSMLILGIEDWIRVLTEVDFSLRTISLLACKLRLYSLMTTTHMSSWTIVIVTVQRAVLVCFPTHAQQICTAKNTVKAWVLITLFWMLWNLHYFWTSILFNAQMPNCHNGHFRWVKLKFCKLDDDNPLGIPEEVINWCNLVTYSAMPAVIICLSNGSIIYTLTRQTARFNNNNTASSSSPSASRHKRGNARKSSMTRMLIAVSTMFLLTTLPSAIFFIRNSDWFGPRETLTRRNLAHFEFAGEVVTLLFYVNNASNFFLYVLSGPSFRRAFVALVCRRKATSTRAALHDIDNRESSMSV